MEHNFANLLHRSATWAVHITFDIYRFKERHIERKDGNKHERLLKGRKTLCDDPNFTVLHVQDDGKNDMRLVRPADNPIHHDAIIQKGYHVLSHVWGNINDYPKWDVSTFITEVDGQPAKPVPMRPEKRNTLLALLKANPGYWWIDVMCARVDTPLVIMGSIYRFCGTCHVMVDCPLDLIADLKKSRLADFDRELTPLYLDASQYNRYHIYSGDLDKAHQALVKAREDQWKAHKSHKTLIKLHKVINRFHAEFNCMQKLLDSGWFNRLWTLQEVALPTENVRLLSEQCGGPDNDVIYFDYNVVDSVSQKIFNVSSSAASSLDPETVNQVIGASGAHLLLLNEKEKETGTGGGGDQYCKKIGMISNDRTPAQDYLKCLLVPDHPFKAVCLRAVLSVFANSSRKCFMPEDYVYGILGLLSLDIPRMQDPQRVWETFIQKLEDLLIELSEDERQGLTYFSLSKKAKTFQLAEAKNMADVYSGLVVMELNDWNVYMFDVMEVYQRKKPDKECPPEYVAGWLIESYETLLPQYKASKTRFYI